MKQTGRERAAPCASPTIADRKVTGEILAAAAIRCRAEMCLTDDSTLEDKVLRLPQTSNKSCAIFLQQQPRQSFINGLIWLFESFSGTPRRTLAELRAGLCDRLEANTTVIRIFELLHIFRVRQDSATAAVSSFIPHLNIRRISPGEVCRRGDEKRGEINTWLGTSNLPPSKAGRFNGAFEKQRRKMLLQGSTARLKAAVLLFHFALTRRLQTTDNLSVFVLFSSQGL